MNFGRNLSDQSITKLAKSEAVQVVVRCRPMSLKEQSQGHTQIIDMWPNRGIVHIINPKRTHGCQGKMFTFDSVYDWNANQDDLYEPTVKPLVYSVLDGFNGTIFAYGQTGTGKTYTMLGSRCNPKEKGIISKCFEDIYRHINLSSQVTSYVVRASYLEIYQEETRDLLSPDVCKKPLREDVVRGVYVKGLQSVVCKNIKAIERVMRMGNMNRATAATNMNEHSSRSHAIFQITIEMRDRSAGPRSSRSGVRVGKLNLVDLAGSERQCKTGAEGERLKESGKINLSLSALGNVIKALVDGRSSHIPYRDSKLTQLLQDSLGGNSKSIMIANIGPASYNYDESLMTLRYASRAKHIRNRPTRNENPLNSMLSHYNEEMRTLKSLIGQRASAAAPTDAEDPPTAPVAPRHKLRAQDRRRRPHHRVVWKLHGKYRPETTVQMVRWIQEQINSRSRSADPYTKQSQEMVTRQAEALTNAELGVHQLVDDLSDAVHEQLSEEKARRTQTVRAYLKLAAEVKELRARAQRQHQRRRAALHSEQARLRKDLALKHAVLRAYLADRRGADPDRDRDRDCREAFLTLPADGGDAPAGRSLPAKMLAITEQSCPFRTVAL